MTQKHYCPNCGLPVKEAKMLVENHIRGVSTCNKCGGHLTRLDNATLMVYDNPGFTMAAMNLEDVGRAIFTIYYQRGYIACADLHHDEI